MDVKLPPLGEGADSGNVVSIFVKEGDTVKKDQVVLELESEKAVASIPTPSAGKVSKLFVKEGEKISVGQLILSLSEEGAAQPEKTQETTEKKVKEPETTEIKEEKHTGEEEPAGEISPRAVPGVPPPAAPSVRKIALELGIDLTKVQGSERGGRIVMGDLRTYIQRLQQIASAPKGVSAKTEPKSVTESVDFSKWGAVNKKPLTSLRKIIAERMLQSWATVPRVTQFDEADITELLVLRKKHEGNYEKQGAHLTITPFILKACVTALKKHPDFNASLDEAAGEIVFKEYYHLGIAVDTEAGLMVPVIRDVDKKSILQISKELDELANKAKERKILLDELKGGTFTISNQGGIGGGHFTPMVNTPEAAILGVGRGSLKPVVRDKKIEARMILPLALSYDHRLVDGANAVRFLLDIKQALEEFSEKELSS